MNPIFAYISTREPLTKVLASNPHFTICP
uniref:Uncharacterized protein n=1 Tax=Rhizophora mucronata TaxID=61149 RepID=A0A2P2PTS3_RHIMU